jgi:hypothetical protein
MPRYRGGVVAESERRRGLMPRYRGGVVAESERAAA